MAIQHRLAFLGVLTLAQISNAQCDPKQYTQIFSEAQSLQTQGQFIEAKNKYEAAKIYACGPKDLDKADKAVDALFEQIDKLREQAENALARVADNMIRDAQTQIYHLDYEGASATLESALSLNVAGQKLSDALLEIIFFYTETGRFDRARTALDHAARLSGRDFFLLTTTDVEDVDAFRLAIKTLSQTQFDLLNARYFPQMLDIPGGTDILGRERSAFDVSESESPPHAVTLSAFKLAKTETTWWQYNLFCESTGKTKPDKPGWGCDGDNPVLNVSWYDAVEYSNWLSKHFGEDSKYFIDKTTKDPSNDNVTDKFKWTVRSKRGSKGYRLPTEAEWEYAARAGEDVEFAGSSDHEMVAWSHPKSSHRTHPVAMKKPNKFGLYDMNGNVWEWCWDRWSKDYYTTLATSTALDPEGPETGSSRVFRGGSWYSSYHECTVYNRSGYGPNQLYTYYGFRVAQGVSKN